MQETLDRLFEATSATVTWAGPYDHDRDLPRLMSEIDWVLVPSVWWENSPLVIQEAFQHGRPVICSDIGGMAEQVSAWRGRAALPGRRPGQPWRRRSSAPR